MNYVIALLLVAAWAASLVAAYARGRIDERAFLERQLYRRLNGTAMNAVSEVMNDIELQDIEQT